MKTNSYEYLSPAFTEIISYTPEDMMTLPSETILGMIHPDDIPEINSIIQESLIPPFGHSNKIQCCFKNKSNGDHKWLCDHACLVEQPSAFIGSVSDISEQKEYEKKPIESKERLQSIFINFKDAYFETDSTGRFTTVSPVSVKTYRYSSIE